jgi:hypothetical protein
MSSHAGRLEFAWNRARLEPHIYPSPLRRGRAGWVGSTIVITQPWKVLLQWKYYRLGGLCAFKTDFRREIYPKPVSDPVTLRTIPRVQIVDTRVVTVPHWFAALLFGAWPVVRIRRWRRTRRRLARGQCTNCGYDLRGSHDRCPECGAPIALPLAGRTPSSFGAT